jgi:hypothetical protein
LSDLRQALIRLAYENPGLRKDLLPLLGRPKKAGAYTRPFSQLVNQVDKITDASKALQTRGKIALRNIARMAYADPFFLEKMEKRPGLKVGLKQVIGEMGVAIERAMEEAGRLEDAYDEMNWWFQEHGLT